jgi:hypothetical protein
MSLQRPRNLLGYSCNCCCLHNLELCLYYFLVANLVQDSLYIEIGIANARLKFETSVHVFVAWCVNFNIAWLMSEF